MSEFTEFLSSQWFLAVTAFICGVVSMVSGRIAWDALVHGAAEIRDMRNEGIAAAEVLAGQSAHRDHGYPNLRMGDGVNWIKHSDKVEFSLKTRRF
ncbi:hypothetical protein [Maricaulis sp.]|uniref:hypothetical protein n=1 Tax=Maricaulis sp. TaxID=1486257 RepID=UPI003A8D1DB0